ncbi:MAG TPA: HD domain-containing protein [Thermomicrobiales bacterium]|nr:HD domain-containing protein [Thermomicrobiales bacterium]
MSSPDDMVRLFRQLLALKSTPRTGWLDRGMPPGETESIADHILMATLIGWLAADASLDRDRVLKLALVHDLAEAITGDPPPYARDHVPPASETEALREFFARRHVRSTEDKAAKDHAEGEAMERLRALMPAQIGEEIVELWHEYEEGATPEARFAKDVDRFEAFLQARDYARRYPDLPFDGFTRMAEQELQTPALIALRDAILAKESPGS